MSINRRRFLTSALLLPFIKFNKLNLEKYPKYRCIGVERGYTSANWIEVTHIRLDKVK